MIHFQNRWFSALFFLALILLPSSKAYSEQETTKYFLHRVIQWKYQKESDDDYRTWKKYNNDMEPLPYGINTAWGGEVRVDTLYLQEMKWSKPGELEGTLSYETQPWPMDGNWNVVWKRRQRFALNQPFVFKTQIKDKVFQVTMFIYTAPTIQEDLN